MSWKNLWGLLSMFYHRFTMLWTILERVTSVHLITWKTMCKGTIITTNYVQRGVIIAVMFCNFIREYFALASQRIWNMDKGRIFPFLHSVFHSSSVVKPFGDTIIQKIDVCTYKSISTCYFHISFHHFLNNSIGQVTDLHITQSFIWDTLHRIA